MTIRTVLNKYLLFCLGSLMLVVLLFFTFVGPYLPFVDHHLKEYQYKWINGIPMIPPFPPSKEYIWGSDRLGRDLLSLIILGAKQTLVFVALITLFRYLLAIPLAFLAHKKIWGMQGLLQFLNAYFSYFPSIFMFILIASLPPLQTSPLRPYALLFILGFMEVGRAGVMLKDEFDHVSSQYFIESGIAAGNSSFRMLRLYYLPFLYDKIIISIITDLGKVMFLLGQVGFIGVYLSQKFWPGGDTGIAPVNTSMVWPGFFDTAFRDIRAGQWIVFYPGLAITFTIFTFNIFAQGLQKLIK
jgi:peptide/nickel transport system permease protein